MTIAEMAPVVVAAALSGGLYLYLLRERRKLRDHRAHPAE